MREGDEVLVTLPDDVEGWYQPPGASWVAVVVYVNGESVDVEDKDGNIEPVPIEWCRPKPAHLGPRGRRARSWLA